MDHANDIAVRTVFRRESFRPESGGIGDRKPEAMGMKKILVIDYDQNSLAYLCKILTAEGYQVDTAADGQAGWDKYVKEDPDLVLMEAMLPKVHGFELCQRITTERDSQTTVFIMTGVYKDRIYRTEALRTYGACEYFEKPLKMPEVLAAIEKAIGRSVPRDAPRAEPQSEPLSEPAPEPGYEFQYGPVAAKPARDIRPEPAPPALHKREKPKSDDDIFSLPADLDQLSREIPRVRKPAAARHEPRAEERFDAIAEELLKKVVSEPAPLRTRVTPRPTGGNGNGNGSAEIDNFLKSALAGFEMEKVKVPKTAPLPPVPPPAPEKPRFTPPPPPVAAKPKPAPARVPDPPAPSPSIFDRLAAEKPTPPPAPAPDPPSFAPARERAAAPTMKPGDPGSDVSPFFTPEKPKAQAPPARPEFKAPAPRTFPHAERTEKKADPVRTEPATHEPQRYEPFRPEPIRREPARQEPVRPEPKIIPGDIFQAILEEAERPEKKKREKTKAVSPVVAVVAIVAVVAAVAGFLILKSKSAARGNAPAFKPRSAAVRENVPAPPVEVAAPPEVKSEAAEPKPEPKSKPKAKSADPGPSGVEAIIPASTKSAALPPSSNPANAARSGGQTASASNPGRANPAPLKTEETAQPPATSDAAPPADSGNGSPAEAPVVIPPPPDEPPVTEGALVDIATVTDLPKLVKSISPVYPQTAQRRGIEGTIKVNALIDEKGNVIDTAILKGIQNDRGLGKAAETALKKWKFEPARKNGVAVKMWWAFAIEFKVPK